MKTKLITIHACDTAKEVLLFTDCDDNGDLFVNIQCWHSKDDNDFIQVETFKMPTYLMASRFICDFSEMSANEFANAFTF